MNEDFLASWNQAKQEEEKGHKFFHTAKFDQAAECHKTASTLFLDAFNLLAPTETETRTRAMGNHHIELANYYHSVAMAFSIGGEKEEALERFKDAIEEQKDALSEFQKLEKNNKLKHELSYLKASLHHLLAYENIIHAQIAFLHEEYVTAVEKFKTAEIHSNLEVEFISALGELARLKLAKARVYYIRGQILRSQALIAIHHGDREAAKASYSKAADAFEDAAKLSPQWIEYGDLAKKSRRMAQAIKA
jgi:tetratricopeptide (TPR) repeat protein